MSEQDAGTHAAMAVYAQTQTDDEPQAADLASKADNADPSEHKPFSGYVVGIGASAGGLEALEEFFKHCPCNTGAVFVVIQHLSPDHKSMMSHLLARHTRMPVVMVENDMPIVADHVYLIPPGAVMRIGSGNLYLTPKSPHGLTLPIDIFFNSLAEAYNSRTVGVVLSGTGSDGTRGAVAINAAGGLLLAQDPKLAKFDGMPRSVISTGVVDAVLPASELATRLLAHIRNLPYEAHDDLPLAATRAPLSPDSAFAAIMQRLQQVGEIDFNDYKPATVLRRIERRMQVRHATSLASYFDLLEQERSEVLTLRRELLIPVTRFFRDPESFETVANKAIKDIMANAHSSDTIRVWTAGVSTGEEAYSLGILFLEAFDRERRWPNLKIFATDVNPQNIELAGMGQYPESAAVELSPERLERYFVKAGSTYAVTAELRRCIVFARHNLLTDPPFTRMDLVSCRNTLIYFKPQAQTQALKRLQYALKPGGYLFLGSSESLSREMMGFSTMSSTHKLFKRTGNSQPVLFNIGASSHYPASDIKIKKHPTHHAATAVDGPVIDYGLAALLDSYAPPAILVNDRHEAVHLFGNVQPYFQVRQGSASLEISRILPDILIPVAAALLFKAGKDGDVLTSDTIRVPFGHEDARSVKLTARPLKMEREERFLLLCFEELPDQNTASTATTPINVDAETTARLDTLERELAATRESLQATIEELETSNEELQATNEELMASNEELQSSNEELQSVNEELNTVNAEFQEKMVMLNRVNADLESMAKAVGVATVFVDHELHVTRFSPDAISIFKLREYDIGRPLDDITHTLKYPSLMEDLRNTLLTERMIQREVLSSDGRLYLARILPYRIPSNATIGVVATFVDVSVFRDLQRLQAIIDALPEHVVVLDHDGTIALVNAAWSRFARANGDTQMRHSGPGANYFSACQTSEEATDGRIAHQALQGVRAVLEGSKTGFSIQYPCHSPTEKRWFMMHVAPVIGQEFGAVVSHIDISSWYDDNAEATPQSVNS